MKRSPFVSLRARRLLYPDGGVLALVDSIDTIFAGKPDPQKWIRRAISGAPIVKAIFEELR